MAEVPYNATATVSPQVQAPEDYQRIPTDAAEFGGAVAQGLEKFGQGASGAGKFWGSIQTDGSLNNAYKSATDIVENFKNLHGQDALNAQAGTQEALDKAFSGQRDQLSTPEQQFQFDQESRSFRQRFLDPQIYSHATQQGFDHAVSTNQDQIKLGFDQIAANADDPVASNAALQMVLKGAGQNAHLHLGEAASLADTDAYMRPYLQGALKTQAESLAVKDPMKAAAFVEQNKDRLGIEYPALADQIRTRADQSVAIYAGNQAITGSGMGITGVQPSPSASPPSANPPSPNNLGNVKTTYGAQTGAADFVQPATPADGATLAANTLRKGYQGLTLEQIGQKWEGTANNPTWTENVSKATGIAPNAVPNLNDPDQLGALLRGINVAEKSPQDQANFTPAVIQQGVQASFSGAIPQLGASSIKANAYQAIEENPNLTPNQRQLAVRYVNEQYTNAQVAAEATKAAQQERISATVRQVSDAIYANPTQDIGPILAQHPELTGEQAEHARNYQLQVLQDRTNGKPGDYGPGYSSVQDRILSTGPDRIVNQEQLLSMTGTGGPINPAGYRAATALLDEVNKPNAEGDRITMGNFYKSAEHSVTLEDPQFNMKRTGGDVAWNRALPVLNDALSAGRAKGLTNAQMTNPDSKDSIWPLLKPFQPTPAEAMSFTMGEPTTQSPQAPNGPPGAAALYLRAHPELRDQFETKYGVGSANSILGPSK